MQNSGKYSGVELFFYQRFTQIFLPVIASFAEILVYMMGFLLTMLGTEQQSSAFIASCLVFWGYVIIVHMLQVFHSEFHKNEGLFTVCINMICLENIVMYIFSVVSYFFYKIILAWSLPEWVFIVGLFTIGLLALWIMLFYLLYFFIGSLISLTLPLIVISFGTNLNANLLAFIFILSMLFSSQVLWRASSEGVYKALFGVCTRHKIYMD